MMSYRIAVFPFLVAAIICASATTNEAAESSTPEKLPPGTRVLRIEAQPAAIALKTPYSYAQVLLTAYLDSGDRVDVTRMVQVQTPGNLVKVSPVGLVRPSEDGNGELKFTLAGQTALVPVTVAGVKQPYDISFVRDVMPMMSKIGCNAGTCHGAAKGKNGFKLSLRGYDPLSDHQALTDDLEGRRFNRSAPERSLMLLKPSGGVPHVGGVLIRPGEPSYELLRAWIAEGVKLDLDSPRLKSIDISPKSAMVPLPEMKQQMAVIATYTDGSVRDVTAEAFIESSNTEVATVDKQALVTTLRRGEATMLARYEGVYTATTLVVMGDRSGYAWKDVAAYNYIDELVYEKLKSVKVLPSDVCTDTEFVRRIYLDLTGLPPQVEEVRAFMADPTPSRIKREKLVDKLIGSPDYVEFWTNKWADLLQVNRKFLGEEGAAALRKWIRDAVAKNMAYDQFVHTILTASGSTLDNPPATYFKVLRDPGAAMENTTQLFLAIRFNCNKCHDHPFERWTQDQYYELSAYFAQVGRQADPKAKGKTVGGTNVEGATPLVEIISDTNAGDVRHERTGAVTPPKFPYVEGGHAPAAANRRQQLASWIASRDNPYFAKSYVNRVWSYLLGVGLIEPIDDIRAGNPPSNPKLLDRLTNEFIAGGFNVRELERTICKSRTYQLSFRTNRWNEGDDLNYAHAVVRRLPAEVMYDAILRATGSSSRLPGLPAGARAAQLLDSNVEIPSDFLGLFGKPPRESACECERSASMMLGPVLNLVNGPIVGEALKDPANRLAKLVTTEKDDAKVVEGMYFSILCRPPSKQEIEAGVKALHAGTDEFARMLDDYNKQLAAVAAYEKQIPVKQAEWEKNYKNAAAWTMLDPVSAVSAGGATLTKQPDSSVLAGGKNPSPDVYTVTANTQLTGITAIRLEVLPDPKLPNGGPGRSPTNGNFVLNEFRLTAAPLGEPGKAKPVVFHKATADYSQPSWAVAGAIDGNPQTGWAVDPAYGKRHVAVFETREPIGFPTGTILTFTLDQQFPGKDHNIGRFRLSATATRPPVPIDGPPDAIARILAVAPEKRTNEQKAELARHYRSLDAELARLQQIVADQPKPPADRRLLGAQDLAWALINTPEFLFNH